VGVDKIILAGIEDPNGYADMKTPAELAAEIREAEGEAFSVLLSHRPDGFEEYAALGFNLVLSGHIHGGLIRLPFIGGLFSPGMELLPKYSGGAYAFTYTNTAGLARTGRLIVSRGLSGAVGIPRLFNRLDIPLVTLRKS
jgi:predicted MPP superfamily phosphohydrolase